MNLVLVALVVVLALLLAWWAVRRRTARPGDGHGSGGPDTLAAWPPQATRVLTSDERQAYDVLRSALPAHIILAQVPLQRFIKVPTRNSYAEWLRRVGHLSADFVVCDRHSQVMAVVELRAADEPPPGRAQRRAARLVRVLEAAKIPVHIWSPGALPSVDNVRDAIAPAPPVTEVPPAVSPSILNSAPGRPLPTKPSPRVEEPRPSRPDDAPPMRDAPPSTWFDDIDTEPAPLAPDAPPAGARKDRGPPR